MTLRQDLHITQGADWSFAYTKAGGPDLTTYSARMSVKRCAGGGVEAFFSTGADADGGSISLSDAGVITLSMTAAQAAAFGGEASAYGFADDDLKSWASNEWRYDLELVSPAGVVTRELEGRVFLREEITG